MRLIAQLFFICLFISCSSNNDSISKTETDSLSAHLNIIDEKKEICYDANNDVSDSVKILFDEAMAKKHDFNRAKFETKIKKWHGKSVTFENLPISSMSKEGTYTSPHIVVLYDKWRDYAYDVSMDIFVDIESDEKLANFEIGQMVTICGVIEVGFSRNMGNSIHLSCGIVIP